LRKENDRFSTHNQNYGVTFFDNWQAYLWYYGLKVRLESHDEILLYVKEEEVEEVKILLKRCCEMANRKLNLPVYVDIDIQVGKSYADTH
jgi:DNA polymerase I-like protein with 3'-5' exonuclease and polymerase domains